ncbi:ATP-dependent DNA helicase Q5 [Megalopta genalis]|uniref:ATP-dependent DNA helicase Q5 n=1 Tax=Megalopta genalis TaxID=115081 RepID=UPI003FD12A16
MSNKSCVTSTLQTVFGYDDFRNIIHKKATLLVNEGLNHVCISTPPDFDSSLCFEIPAILKKGKVAVVFSSKLCFMENRVDFFRNKQIKVHLLSKCTSPSERDVILRDFTSSNYLTIPLLYATPDMIDVRYFQHLVRLLKRRKLLSYIVFNEAHSLSEWGYDYVPCYGRIRRFNRMCGNVPRVAITTTVNNKVIDDICQLTLKRPRRFKVPILQTNVCYDIWFLDILPHPFEHLKNFIINVLGFLSPSDHKTHDDFGIIYCNEEVKAEVLKERLVAVGIPTIICNHKLNTKAKYNIKDRWLSGSARVIVTTHDCEFIYRKPIKCKVYWTVPENISKYYRESVQSFTNNYRTYCRIYFSTKEYSSIKMLIENSEVGKGKGLGYIKHHLNEYNKLVSYCLLTKCRHATISKYFGYAVNPCQICDVCEDMNVVEVRTHKFIAYSKEIQNITYNVYDINEAMKERQNQNIEKVSQEYSEEESNKCDVARKEISVVRNNSDAIVQYRDKQKSSSPSSTRLSTKDYIHASSGSSVRRAKDNSNDIDPDSFELTCSLLSTCNLNNKIPLKPCSLESNIIQISTRLNDIHTNVSYIKSKSKVANSDARAWTAEKKGQITASDSCETIFVGVGSKERNETRRKRCRDADTCPAEFSLKRRKFGTENKPTAVIRDRRRSKETSDRVEDDANESLSRSYTIAEYLMDKYKLNRDAITLFPCRK